MHRGGSARGRSGAHGRSRLLALLLLLPLAWVVLLPAPAQAHAYLVASNPADGASVERAPVELRLQFSEHVVPEATTIDITTSGGRTVHLRGLRVLTQDPQDTEEPVTVAARLPRLAADSYRVSWETLSSDDLHRTAGILVFGVGRQVVPAGSSSAPVRGEEVVLRGLLLACLAVAVGGLLAGAVLRRALRVPSGTGDPQVVVWPALVAAWSSTVLGLWLLVDQLVTTGTGATQVLLGAYGLRWLVRAAGLLLLVRAWTLRARTPGRRARVTAALGVGLSCVGTALLGHLATTGVVGVAVTSLHVAAATAWAGAVAILAAHVLHAPSGRVTELLRVLRAFGLPAAACLTAAAVTGVLLSSHVVGSVDAAVMTAYGRTLAVKVLLVAVAATLGLRHHLAVRGPHDLDVPRRSLALEGGALVGVLLVTGLLASSGTATDPVWVRDEPAATVVVSRQVGDLQLSGSVAPNRPGRAVAVVDVFDTRRPAPAPVTGVDLRLDGRTVALTALADGHWTSPVTLAAPGRDPIGVVVHRAGLRDSSTTLRWVVGGRVHRPVVISQRPLRTPLLLGGTALLALALAGWAVVGLRLSRRPAQGATVGTSTPVAGSNP